MAKKKVQNNSEIPYGDYCYRILRIDHKTCVIHTKVCPYLKNKKDDEGYNSGYCSKLKVFDIMLDDQCKICGINEYGDEDTGE